MQKNTCNGLGGCKNKKIKEFLDNAREVLLDGELNNALCYDGVVNEEKYEKAKPKLAFLLKETNGNGPKGEAPEKYDDWDYMKWVRDIVAKKEKLYPTFRNIAMWSGELFDIMEKGEINKSEYIKDGVLIVNEKLIGNLEKIAIINLKKTWGKGTTDSNKLEKYLSNVEIRKILQKELSIVAPDVVICGSNDVFDFACKIYAGEEKTINTKEGNELQFFKNDKTIFVKFYHPACRKRRETVFDYAGDVFDTLNTIMRKA